MDRKQKCPLQLRMKRQRHGHEERKYGNHGRERVGREDLIKLFKGRSANWNRSKTERYSGRKQ